MRLLLILLLSVLHTQTTRGTGLDKKVVTITECLELGLEVAEVQSLINKTKILEDKFDLIYDLAKRLPTETVPIKGTSQSFTEALTNIQNRLKITIKYLKSLRFFPQKYIKVFAQSELFDIKKYNETSFKPHFYFVFFTKKKEVDAVVRGPVQIVEHDANHGVSFRTYLNWLFNVSDEKAYLKRIKNLDFLVSSILAKGRTHFNVNNSDLFFDVVWFVASHEKNFFANKITRGSQKRIICLFDKNYWGNNPHSIVSARMVAEIKASFKVLGYNHLLTRTKNSDKKISDILKFIGSQVVRAPDI